MHPLPILHEYPTKSLDENLFENLYPSPNSELNAQPPRDAVRKQKNVILRMFLVQYCHPLKDITPLET